MFFLFIFNPYIAIIADIKKSKQLIDRSSIQHKMEKTLDGINEKYEKDIASKFMITLGDEFQGLLKCGDNVMNIISEIEAVMYPVKIRFGIGVGEITTEVNPEVPLGADGPAYYNARNAIEFLKSSENKSKMADSNIMLKADGNNEASEKMINTILSLLTVIKNKWTDRQREVIRDYVLHEDNQKSVGQRLGITQSSVQKNLSNADYYSYKEAVELITKALSEIKRRRDV